jgi:hypothetical protein
MPDSCGMVLIYSEGLRAPLSPLIVVMILKSLRKNICSLEVPLLIYLLVARVMTRLMSRDFFWLGQKIRHFVAQSSFLLFTNHIHLA